MGAWRKGFHCAEEAITFAAALQDLMQVSKMDAEQRGCGAKRVTLVPEKCHAVGGGLGFRNWHLEVALVECGPPVTGDVCHLVLWGSPMQEESSLKFSDRLHRAMAARGMNAAELATKAVVSKGYVSEILGGKKAQPSFETCKKISDVLQISPMWLIYGEGIMDKSVVCDDVTPYRFTARENQPDPTMAEAFQRLGEAIDMLKKIIENPPKGPPP